MEYITKTQLRTKSSQLVNSLKKGDSIPLIHRSQVIGEIKPVKKKLKTIKDVEEFKKAMGAIGRNIPTTYAQREKIYRAHLMKKYGKGLPGR